MFFDPPNLILIACKNLPKQSSNTQQLVTGHRVLYVKWQASRSRLPRTPIAPCKSVITASGRYKNLEMLVTGQGPGGRYSRRSALTSANTPQKLRQ